MPAITGQYPTIRLFALDASRDFGQRIAADLGIELTAHEERSFEDGEHKTRALVNVRGSDVFVVHSLYGDREQSGNDKLVRLLFFLGALKDAHAGRVTAVVPYLAYARKDRRTKSRDPVTTRYVAQLLEAVGVDQVVTMDVHNLAAYQNAFRCPTDHLEGLTLFLDHLKSTLNSKRVAVLSPDIGGVKRARRFRDRLEQTLGERVPVAIMEKGRSAGVVSGEILVGDVNRRTVVIVDDLISSGTTLARAARAAVERGAAQVCAVATHAVFSEGAERNLGDPALRSIVVTDTVPPAARPASYPEDKVRVLDSSGLFAEGIKRIHEDGSLVDLRAIE